MTTNKKRRVVWNYERKAWYEPAREVFWRFRSWHSYGQRVGPMWTADPY